MNVVVKRNHYTTVTSAAIRDKRLSLKARGLLCFCMSLSEKWKYSIQGLATAAGVGVDSIKSAIKELENCGYLVRTKYRDEHGRMACDYVISDEPIEQPKEESEDGQCESDHSGKTTAEKPPRFSHHGSTAAENPLVSIYQEVKSKSKYQKDISKSSSSSNVVPTIAEGRTTTTAAAKEAISFWIDNTGQYGEVIRSDISDLTDKYGAEFVKEAMREAIRSNVRKIKYVEAIAERMASGQERKAKEAPATGNAWNVAFEKLFGGEDNGSNPEGEHS